MKLPVPVTIITGALGAGKTTAICHLLRCKQDVAPNEVWAVLVNEFGALGIDASLMQGAVPSSTQRQSALASQAQVPGQSDRQSPIATAATGPATAATAGTTETAATVTPVTPATGTGRVVVRELAGGCMCCSLSGPLGVSIAQLVRNSKPDRLIIEPSGLGHPAGLLDVIQGEHLRSALHVQAVICLVDCRQAVTAAFASNTTYQDQVNVADILVGTKADLASAAELKAFTLFADELFPPKSQVLTTAHGVLDPSLLSKVRQLAFMPWFNSTTSAGRNVRRAGQLVQYQPIASCGEGLHTSGGGSGGAQDGNHSASNSSASGSTKKTAFSFSVSPGGTCAATDLIDHLVLATLHAEAASPVPDSGTDGLEEQDWQWQQAQAAWAQGRPARFLSKNREGYVACGWLFPPDRRFAADKLQQLAGALSDAASAAAPMGATAAGAGAAGGGQSTGHLKVQGLQDTESMILVRAKGVLRTSARGWVSMQAEPVSADLTSDREPPGAVRDVAEGGSGKAAVLPGSTGEHDSNGSMPARVCQLKPIAYRKDSRLEVILGPWARAGQKHGHGHRHAAATWVPRQAQAAAVPGGSPSNNAPTGPATSLADPLQVPTMAVAGPATAAAPGADPADPADPAVVGRGENVEAMQDECSVPSAEHAVHAAVLALLRQDWDSFESCLCACCTP